jgi:tetratricopeptide (TPR) repeat protein
MLRISFSCVVGIAAFVSTASAQAPRPIQLWLTPAKPPTPALRYQLLPDDRQTTSDNAAAFYKQAIDVADKKGLAAAVQELDEYLRLPLHQFPKEEMRKFLAEVEYTEIIELLDKGARCDHCDWGYRERLREQGINALLPELQPLRNLVRLLAVKARLEMAEGQPSKALATLRTGLAMARHTGENETLIAFLVGVATASVMEMQLDQLISLPDAPNLYYALTELPTPLISMRRGLESERLWMPGTLPGFGDVTMNLEAGNVSEDNLKKYLKLLDLLRDGPLSYPERLFLGLQIEQKHELAKQALIDAGRPRDKVEAMPPLQVAWLHALLEYDAAIDNLIVAEKEPYWVWSARASDVNDHYLLKKRWLDYRTSAIPLTPLMLPAFKKVTFARARNERKLALLRTVEALRYYAAEHDGQLPPSLAAIREVPLPLDPMTGRGFEYQRDGDLAKLRAPVPAGQTQNVTNSVVYELKIRKQKE